MMPRLPSLLITISSSHTPRPEPTLPLLDEGSMCKMITRSEGRSSRSSDNALQISSRSTVSRTSCAMCDSSSASKCTVWGGSCGTFGTLPLNPSALKWPTRRVTSTSTSSQLPTKSTRPRRLATLAFIVSPVQKSHSHAAGVSRCCAATLTTPGSARRRISGNPNVASVCASTAVPRQGNTMPPPRVAPWQITILGIRVAFSRSSISPNAHNPCKKPPLARFSGDGSAPRQKCSAPLLPRKMRSSSSGHCSCALVASDKIIGMVTCCRLLAMDARWSERE
eukprot:7391811-Prymnesium_polylepis.2